MQTRTLLAGLTALTFAGVSNAALVGVASVSTTEAPAVGSSAAGIADGSGLQSAVTTDAEAATVLHEGIFGPAPASAFFISGDNGAGSGTDWFATGGAPTDFDFTLTGASTVGGMYMWGYTGDGFTAGGNSFSDMTVSFSTDGGATYGGAVAVTYSAPPDAAGPSASQFISFGSAVAGVTNIRITVEDNHFGSTTPGVTGGDRIGVAEIIFTDVVPEPGSLALLGLGGLMIARRRRG